ncbi:MAG: tRNA (adenosine(37)-N6)-dimethylallyltransferase MiaA [Candidatus Eisenbacteria bacterium]|nr:tRNA (adenosine(37)-N6)-dimethylallyltransferase MiaA [Candidatus Eisenbacteria bacterium]
MSGKSWAIFGPTGGGKTEAALALAERFPLEVVGLDSRQLYIGMDIGTAKPTEAQRARVPHHMIDVITPDVRWDAMTYARAARPVIDEITARGRRALIVGGSGFYFAALAGELNEDLPPRDEALRARLRVEAEVIGSPGLWERLREHDAATAARLHPQDMSRIIRALEILSLTGTTLGERARTAPPVRWGDWSVIVLAPPRDRLKALIRRRVTRMIREGWAEEVRRLLHAGHDESHPGMSSLGYPEMIEHVRGIMPAEEAVARIAQRTWQYARRQLTWFRRFPAERWIATDDPLAAAERAASLLDRRG